MPRIRLLFSLILLWVMATLPGAVSRAEDDSFLVVAYNVENLFDVDGVALFEDYAPDKYGPAHLRTKLVNIAHVLATFDNGRGPDIILFEELEADQAPGATPFDVESFRRQYAATSLAAMLAEPLSAEVRDLPAEAFLLKALDEAGLGPYAVRTGHYEPDPTGRTIAHVNATFSRFPIVDAMTHPSPGARGTLEVIHDVSGHRLHTFNVHWKSGASDPDTELIRLGNARVLRERLNQLLRADPHADVILGGDFNSQYNQATRYPAWPETAIHHVLGSRGEERELQRQGGPDLYNLWFELPPQQRGSDVYEGYWGTLMQLLLVRGLYDSRGVQYVDNSFGVAIREDLNSQTGSQVPLHWIFAGDTGSGFSDHFPVYARFRVVEDNDPTRYQPLTDPGRPAESDAEPRAIDYSAARDARLPAARDFGSDAALRETDHLGRVYRVDAVVSGEKPFRIRLFQEEYNLWAFELDLRLEIYRRFQVGDQITICAELGVYRDKWQFVVRDRSWLEPLD